MKRNFLIFLFLFFIVIPTTKAQDYAASLKLSTLGINLEALRSFGEDFNARVGLAFFSYNINGSNEDYTYKAKAKLFSVSLLADYFPFGQTFRITGGALINLNKGNIDLVPAKSTTIGGDLYSPDKLGNLTANIKFNRAAPYIGIGFGNPVSGETGFNFTFDLGTIYQGPAKVDLSAEGLLQPSAAPDQEQRLADNLNWFKWYPVMSVGLAYKF